MEARYKGKTRVLKIDQESPSAITYGNEVIGKVIGNAELEVNSEETLRELYPNLNRINVIVIEDEAGIHWKIPERDITEILEAEDLC